MSAFRSIRQDVGATRCTSMCSGRFAPLGSERSTSVSSRAACARAASYALLRRAARAAAVGVRLATRTMPGVRRSAQHGVVRRVDGSRSAPRLPAAREWPDSRPHVPGPTSMSRVRYPRTTGLTPSGTPSGLCGPADSADARPTSADSPITRTCATATVGLRSGTGCWARLSRWRWARRRRSGPVGDFRLLAAPSLSRAHRCERFMADIFAEPARRTADRGSYGRPRHRPDAGNSASSP